MQNTTGRLETQGLMNAVRALRSRHGTARKEAGEAGRDQNLEGSSVLCGSLAFTLEVRGKPLKI